MTELIETLLEAHVQHELARWRGDPLTGSLTVQTRALFRWLAEVRLDDVVSRAQIVGVIERYVIEFRVGGGIAELAGEMSRVLVSSPTSAKTRVDQILPDTSYEEFATKLASLAGVWRELITLVSESSAFAEIVGQVVSRTLAGLLFERAAPEGARSTRGSELASRLAQRFFPDAAQQLTAVIARYLAQHRQPFVRQTEKHLREVVDPLQLRAVLDEVWDTVSAMPLSDAFSFIDERDLEDLVVLGYEFWLTYRKSDYFRQISGELVDFFFAKYGNQSLALLIEDMGVSEQMVSYELVTFLGPIFEHAAHTGFLERQIRAQLEPFYRSPALSAILGAQQLPRSSGPVRE